MFKDIYDNKKVLVTGHTGFKGSWLTQWLLELGAEVCGYSIDIPTNPSHFEVLKLESKIKHLEGDVRDIKSLTKVFNEFQPQIVFHLAAQPLVRSSYDDPKKTFDTNVGGTVNVLECLRLSKSVEAAVIVATDKYYENLESETAFVESDKLGGADPYSASKAAAEIAFISYQKSFFSHQEKLKVASARAGNVIGGGDWAVDRIVPDCVRSWGNGLPVVVRSPHAIRPWQHVLEPVGGYLLLAAQLLAGDKKVIGESFNFGPLEDSSRSVADLLEAMHSFWPKANWEVAAAATIKKEAKVLKLNCEKALTQMGWRSQLNFKDTAKMTADWYQKYLENPNEAAALTLKQIKSYEKFIF
ncbi:MAG: CDP-glucose 4,6-dehydratase [Bdellovibrionales bacterium]